MMDKRRTEDYEEGSGLFRAGSEQSRGRFMRGYHSHDGIVFSVIVFRRRKPG
jgi:hypothetical protein